ncbi:MAG: 6-phosphogluconolactonase [Planctomycetota bacterium]
MSDSPKIEVKPTPEAVAYEAAEKVVHAAKLALGAQDTFTLGLAGGSTPKALYELLASDDFRKQIEWNRVEIFFGDERTVAPDHDDSNYKMAKAALLDHVPIPGDNVYRMKGELPPSEAAETYDALLADRFGTAADDAGIDLLLIGMGDDAHTLSLFPHTEALSLTDPAGPRCVANHVEKLDTWRLTITAGFANRSREVLALVTGDKKADALTSVLEGEDDPKTYPTQLISPTMGRFVILADAAAVGMSE